MADLAVQGSEGKTDGAFCARCFAHVASGEAYCPECGAPTGEASAPGTDSAVHGELAQANLLRLRGELDASEKLLIGILRRFPNDPLAHEMLGDVCVARGERDRAIEWYELALDLAPNSTDVQRKLHETTQQVDVQETADTAETLGLPPASPVAAWWPLAAAGAILFLAIAIAAWPRTPSPLPLRASMTAPLDVVKASPDPEPTVPTTSGPPPVTVPPAQGAEEDSRLLSELRTRPGGSRIQSVVLDPRTQGLVVTFELGETDDARTTATSLGKEALSAAPAASMVTLRGVRAGSLTFAADFARTAIDSSDPLTNLWPSAPGEPALPSASGTTTSGSVGETIPSPAGASTSPATSTGGTTTTSGKP